MRDLKKAYSTLPEYLKEIPVSSEIFLFGSRDSQDEAGTKDGINFEAPLQLGVSLIDKVHKQRAKSLSK